MNILFLTEKENHMIIIIQIFTSQSQWTNQKLNASSVTCMNITNLNIKII